MKSPLSRLLFLSLFGAFSFGNAAEAFGASTWNAAKSGSDFSGNGSASAPFASISKAVGSAASGDTIKVGPGTYIENLLLEKRLTIASTHGAEKTIIQSPTKASAVSARGEGVQGGALLGFTMTGGGGLNIPGAFNRYGGGFQISAPAGVTFEIRDCIIRGNTDAGITFGGGFHVTGGCTLSLINTLVHGNAAWANGGAALVEQSNLVADRCTIVSNTNNGFNRIGGISAAGNCNIQILNSILWNNTRNQYGSFSSGPGGTATFNFSHSIIQGGTSSRPGGNTQTVVLTGPGNLDTDPRFADTQTFRLAADSPAVDAGDPELRDPDGSRLDIGWNSSRRTDSDPTADEDGDGVINARESTDGTNPKDSSSFNPLSRFLFGHYRLDGDFSDASGYQRHATLRTARPKFAFVPGISGEALQLNTNTGFAVPVGYKANQAVSFSLWAQRSREVFVQITLADGEYKGLSFGWGYSESGETAGFFVNTDGTWQGPLATELLKLEKNQWSHVAGVVDAQGNVAIFLDGQRAGSFRLPAQIPWSSAMPNAVVLDFVPRKTGKILGRLDEVRIYGRKLGTGEIALLHNQGNPDRDGDGLLNWQETNTGKFISPKDTGTDPDKADTNGDKIPDGWAVRSGLNPLDDFTGIVKYVKRNPELFDILNIPQHRKAIAEARRKGQEDVRRAPRKFGLMELADLPLTGELLLELPAGTPFALSMPGDWTRMDIRKHDSYSVTPENEVTGNVFRRSPGRARFLGYRGSKKSFPLAVTVAPLVQAETRIIELCFTPVFGNVEVGQTETSYIGIKNTGNSPLTVDGLEMPEGFSGNWSGVIQPGECREVPVTCEPTEGRRYEGTIVIKSDAQGTVPSTPVACKGVERKMAVPATVDFGDVAVGSSISRELVISNAGNVQLSVTGIGYPEGFSGSWTGRINAGASKAVRVRFSPARAGLYQGAIVVQSDATNGESVINVRASGIAAPEPSLPSIKLQPLVFGEVEVGTTARMALVISNTGDAPLSVRSITYPQGFTGASWSGSILPGGSHSQDVSFLPTRVEAYKGVISVASDAASGSATASASGVGVSKPSSGGAIIDLASQLHFSMIADSDFPDSRLIYVPVANTGTADLVITGIEASGDFDLRGPQTPLLIRPRETASIQLRAVGDGYIAGTLRLISNASSGNNQVGLTADVSVISNPGPGPWPPLGPAPWLPENDYP